MQKNMNLSEFLIKPLMSDISLFRCQCCYICDPVACQMIYLANSTTDKPFKLRNGIYGASGCLCVSYLRMNNAK